MEAFALDDDQVAELALVADMRATQRAMRAIGDELLAFAGDHVCVTATIHLFHPDHEREVRIRLADLEDRVAILRHCDAADPVVAAMLLEALDGRAEVAARMDEAVCRIDVSIRRPSASGTDWRLDDLARSVVVTAAHRHTALRAEALLAVSTIVESGLLRLVAGRTRSPDGIAEFALTDHALDSIARVTAFAAEIERIGAEAAVLNERLRFAALHDVRARSRVWLAENDRRRADACAALDVTRAMHAAVAELQRACPDV